MDVVRHLNTKVDAIGPGKGQFSEEQIADIRTLNLRQPTEFLAQLVGRDLSRLDMLMEIIRQPLPFLVANVAFQGQEDVLIVMTKLAHFLVLIRHHARKGLTNLELLLLTGDFLGLVHSMVEENNR